MPSESTFHLNPRLRLSAYPCTLPHVVPDKPDGLEAAFYAACDGARTFEEVLALNPDYSFLADTLESVVWLDLPLSDAAPATPGERTVVIAAHPQDGYLSMGGWLFNRRGALDCRYISCFSRVVSTTRRNEFVSVQEVSMIRRDEAGLCGRILGCENRFLDLPEVELRRAETRPEVWSGNEKQLRQTLKLMLYQILEEENPTAVFAPAGIGSHADQRMIFDAVLELFEDAYFPETGFHFYEDYPYCASYLGIDDFLARFENSYLDVQPWFEDAGGAVERKCSLLSVFRSLSAHGQSEVMRKVGERNLLLPRNGDVPKTASSLERFWKLRTADQICMS